MVPESFARSTVRPKAIPQGRLGPATYTMCANPNDPLLGCACTVLSRLKEQVDPALRPCLMAAAITHEALATNPTLELPKDLVQPFNVNIPTWLT